VVMQPSGEAELTEDFLMPIPSLSSSNSPGIVYYSYTRDTPDEYPIASFQCLLKFVSKEVDPSTGEPEEEGYEDEYQLEDTELSAADYIMPTYVTFASEWDRLRGGVNVTETLSLPAMESLKGKALAVLAASIRRPLTIVLYSCVRLHH
jgi:coatomer subunit gamma